MNSEVLRRAWEGGKVTVNFMKIRRAFHAQLRSYREMNIVVLRCALEGGKVTVNFMKIRRAFHA